MGTTKRSQVTGPQPRTRGQLRGSRSRRGRFRNAALHGGGSAGLSPASPPEMLVHGWTISEPQGETQMMSAQGKDLCVPHDFLWLPRGPRGSQHRPVGMRPRDTLWHLDRAKQCPPHGLGSTVRTFVRGCEDCRGLTGGSPVGNVMSQEAPPQPPPPAFVECLGAFQTIAPVRVRVSDSSRRLCAQDSGLLFRSLMPRSVL